MLILRYIFNLACFSTAFGMTIYWLFKYCKDEDLCKVDFKPFETLSEGHFPMFSFCFWDQLIESKLRRNTTLTIQEYLDIFRGDKTYDGIEKMLYSVGRKRHIRSITHCKITY